jgi:hypothetical protein
MGFIEQWFGISPDGGDGSLETLIVCAALTVVAAVVFRARILRGAAQDAQRPVGRGSLNFLPGERIAAAVDTATDHVTLADA